MKYRLKNTFRLGILFLAIPLLVTDCQKDDGFKDNNTAIQESSVMAKRVTLNEIKENPSLKQSLDKIEKQFGYIKKSNEFSKINATDNSFSILTDDILQVTTDSTEAYTFRIEIPTHSDSSFENFVIRKHTDDAINFIFIATKD